MRKTILIFNPSAGAPAVQQCESKKINVKIEFKRKLSLLCKFDIKAKRTNVSLTVFRIRCTIVQKS